MTAKQVTRLVFVCSGAADVGELTDRAARQMHREGLAAMSCLASIGARDPDVLLNAALAERLLLIDGCPRACARRTFQHAGLHRFLHFDLSELGLLESKCSLNPEQVQRVVSHASQVLSR